MLRSTTSKGDFATVDFFDHLRISAYHVKDDKALGVADVDAAEECGWQAVDTQQITLGSENNPVPVGGLCREIISHAICDQQQQLIGFARVKYTLS